MGTRTELNLRLPNSPGAAGSVCRLLADERVNIIAMMLDPGGHLHLVVDNPVRALGTLRDQHHHVVERDVILVSVAGSPGGLAAVLSLVAAAGVNVEYAYGAGPDPRQSGVVVLGVDDAQRAAAAAGI